MNCIKLNIAMVTSIISGKVLKPLDKFRTLTNPIIARTLLPNQSKLRTEKVCCNGGFIVMPFSLLRCFCFFV